MKKQNYWFLAVTMSLCSLNATAADKPKTKADTTSFLDSVYVAPVGVYRLPNIHDKGEWGAGVEVAYSFNKYVSVGVANISYSGEDGTWDGLLVDETSVQVHTSLLSSANKAVTLGVDASGVRDWVKEDWGFGVGPRLDFTITKNIELSFGSQIRAFMAGGKDLYNYGSLGFSF